MEISSKTKSVFKLSRNNSGLNCRLNNSVIHGDASRSSNHNFSMNSTQEVASVLGYVGEGDQHPTMDIRRPVIKSKFQNYVKNGSNKSLLGLDATNKLNLGEFAKERLNM